VNSYLAGGLFIVLTSTLAVAGMLYVRKKVGVQQLITHHEVAGHLLSVIGTLYAVLLGFVVVDAMQHQQDLRVIVDNEATHLCNIYLTAHGLPAELQNSIRNHCKNYAEIVINEEWPILAKGGYSPEAFKNSWGLWKEITTFDPKTPREEAIQQQLISEICQVTESRRTRLVSASHGVAPVMWIVLIVGGLFTLIFTYFFAVENVKTQVLMTVLVSMTLALNIFLVFVFGYPFSGDISVRPDSFKLDLGIFKHFEDGQMPPKDRLLFGK
jgi:uncharacterized integral membrane protein